MKRTALLIVLVIALVVVGAVVGNLLGRDGGTREVHGIVGSEKLPFFNDPQVTKVFADRGYTYRADPSGSLDMAKSLNDYDFAFPGSKPAAEALEKTRNAISPPVTVFSSPLAIATFTPIVDVLNSAGLARRDPAGGFWTLDLKTLVGRNQADQKWSQIPGNTAHNVQLNVLVATTQPRDSNSAAMFAVILDQITGGDIGAVAKLFSDQGLTDTTSGEPFEKYLLKGKDFAPLVLIYEAQFVDHAYNTGLSNGQTLIYPSPTLVCDHTVVPYTDAGKDFANLLAKDAELQRLAAKHGFRTLDPAVSAAVLREIKPGEAALPDTIAAPVPSPDEAKLHTLLAKVEEKLA